MEGVLDKPDCRDCQAVHIYKGTDPLCAICLPPLLEENLDAFKVWHLVSDQLIVAGMDGTIVGPNQLAIWEVIDRYKIPNPLACFEKVREIFAYVIQRERDSRKTQKSFGE